MKTAVYPGSFDPATIGHLDIILRASKIVDKLIVAPLINYSKVHTFSIDERCEHLRILTCNLPNVEVKAFEGLLVNFVRENNAKIIIRGLRAVTDFEYEFQMALANRNLAGEIETLFISTSLQYLYLSSSTVKEVAKLGADITNMVPAQTKQLILDKFENRRCNSGIIS